MTFTTTPDMGLPKFQWKEADSTYYYFETITGEVIGMTHSIGLSSIYIVKIIVKNEELILGRFVSLDYARTAIENYWFKQSQTLLEHELS